jgi:Uma2 family endonuclease
MALSVVAQRRFSIDEYNQMSECGILREGERVELIDGIIVPLSAHNRAHSDGVAYTTTLLVMAYGKDYLIRVQLPVEVPDRSEPEPDFSVVPIDGAREGHRHPLYAPLVIEVANTSLRYDRKEKASLYASAGIPDYWILNVRDRQVEVHRQPVENAAAPFGWSYSVLTVVPQADTVTPSDLPPVAFSVSEMLGPAKAPTVGL